MKNKILTHWLNGKSVEWIAKREGLTVEQVTKQINNDWVAL